MAKSKGINLNLPSVDDLFTTQNERDAAERESVQEIPIAKIVDFANHPFKVRDDESMQKTVDSVKQYGVLMPAIVRRKEDGSFEMISGHRRKRASVLAGKDTMPCLVRNLTDDEATIIMVDTNLQREVILPSEKAFAYKMKLEAMKRQGERSDLTSCPVGTKLETGRSDDLLAKDSKDSARQIQRYIRLTELIPPLLHMVDEGKIAFRPAVELSYLPQEMQKVLLDAMECEDATPSLAQAIKLKDFAKEGRLEENVVYSILQEEKPNQVEQFKIPRKKLERYFPMGTPIAKMQDTIVKALELYEKRQKGREKREER